MSYIERTNAEIGTALVRHFQKRADPDKQSIFFAGKSFSANQLAYAIEHCTPEGIEHVRMMRQLAQEQDEDPLIIID